MFHDRMILVVQLGMSYVDLYLIHSPRIATPDIPTAWKELEKIKADGFAKLVLFSRLTCLDLFLTSMYLRSIGVSNFDEADLKILLSSAKVKPAVNQVCRLTFSGTLD
jgi:diketogulonate reductase-like aldo/keto reductase